MEIGGQLSEVISTFLLGGNSFFLVSATPWASWPDSLWLILLSPPAASLCIVLGLQKQASISSFSCRLWSSGSNLQACASGALPSESLLPISLSLKDYLSQLPA